MTMISLPTLPALVPGVVTHRRHGPVDHRLRHQVYQWLVDLDALPNLPGPLRGVAGFSAADHLGSPERSIKDNVTHFLALQGVATPEVLRVVMLANARVFGYVFDPLSVFWCMDAEADELVCVIAEVHNTYGERHAYVLSPDAAGSATTDKAFYVSPFYDLAGRYRLNFQLREDRVAVTINLHRGGDTNTKPDFTATFLGRPEPLTSRGLLVQAGAHPFMSQYVSALIKAHGILLWARGLRTQHRPTHQPPEGIVMTQSQSQLDRADDLAPVMPPARPAPARSAIARRLFDYAVTMVPVRVLWPDGAMTGCGDDTSPVFEVVDPEQFYARLARDFLIGFGEAYMAGDWRPAPGHDLADVLAPFATRLTSLVPEPLQKFRALTDLRAPRIRRNTLDGAKFNIEAHYDLSNDLFQRFLDPSMTYSSALFTDDDTTFSGELEAAQYRKIDSILDFAEVGEGSRVLEIGSGWGSLIVRAAQRGAHVTSITLSSEQLALAQQTVDAAGYADQVDLQLRDYREVRGEFDSIVSVEMIEAVGYEFWPTYFQAIDRLLAPGGAAAVQAITMSHEQMLRTQRSHSWILKYIFPGGILPSLRAIDEVLEEHTRLVVSADLSFGRHYAETLKRWRTRFDANWDDIATHGFDERFRRMWEFYLGYCEAGFRVEYIGVHQLQMKRRPR
ncbi:hypothetical protein BH23ACT6_BH23ACT6_09920 [soil metagenome]